VTRRTCGGDGLRSSFGWRPPGRPKPLTRGGRNRLSTAGPSTTPEVRRLTPYDIECGIQIDAAFAVFQGRDADPALARVFAAVVHRRTAGAPDGTNNPFGVRGAGWIGFVGLVRDQAGQHAEDDTTVFATLIDGSRVAALVLQDRLYAPVQAAYRSGDPVRLARAIERSPLRTSIDLERLADEVAGVTRKWWSMLADAFRFRRVRSSARAHSR
jgi:hypothetical protein